MTELIEKYLKTHENCVNYRKQIDDYVKEYVEKITGFVKEAGDNKNIGKTDPKTICWFISPEDNNIIIIYAVYTDKWLDYSKIHYKMLKIF